MEANCSICGGNEFTRKEGFYFCNECGAQADHVRDIQIDNEDTSKLLTRTRIRQDESILKASDITTMECFNYYLKGLVDEMISLGAKSDLKLKALQLWSAFLRKHEMAFFNKKSSELPKLGPCFHSNDAKILYNYQKPKKKRKRNQSDISTVISNSRAWKKQKKSFAQSEYSASFSESQSYSQSIFGSLSSTGSNSQPMRLSFSNSARKHLKRKMSSSHLKKHERNDLGDHSCHQLNIKKGSLCRQEQSIQLNRKNIYTLLYIALNLIGDEIQLSDMIRFLNEGHLSIIKIDHFFPENISKICEDITNSKQFRSSRNIFFDNQIRSHVSKLAKFIHIPALNTPNIHDLVKRYCIEFCLPEEISEFCERLVNLSKPKMKFFLGKDTLMSPNYEARAMAFIIFIMKLLFGLDDQKEIRISDSAKHFNENFPQLPQLFVWTDWMRYIEMRKILLAQYNKTSGCNSKKNYQRENLIDEIINENKITDDDVVQSNKIKILNIKNIFEKYIKDIDEKPLVLTEFPATLYPQTEYLSTILKHFDKEVFVPEFMHCKHSEKFVYPFVNPKKLKKILMKNYSKPMKCRKIACKADQRKFNIFKEKTRKSRFYRPVCARKIDHNITESEWLNVIKKKTFSLMFLKEQQNYEQEKFQYQANNGNTTHLNYKADNIFQELSDEDLTDDDEDNDSNALEFIISSLDYWTIYGKVQRINEIEFNQVISKFPINFLWLMETFSEYLAIDIFYLYHELLTIENYFIYVLDDMEKVEDILIFKPNNNDKELNTIISYYKSQW